MSSAFTHVSEGLPANKTNVIVIYRAPGQTQFPLPKLMTFYILPHSKEWEFSTDRFSLQSARPKDMAFDIRWAPVPEVPICTEPHQPAEVNV